MHKWIKEGTKLGKLKYYVNEEKECCFEAASKINYKLQFMCECVEIMQTIGKVEPNKCTRRCTWNNHTPICIISRILFVFCWTECLAPPMNCKTYWLQAFLALRFFYRRRKHFIGFCMVVVERIDHVDPQTEIVWLFIFIVSIFMFYIDQFFVLVFYRVKFFFSKSVSLWSNQ